MKHFMRILLLKKIDTIAQLKKLLDNNNLEETYQELIATNLWLITHDNYNNEDLKCSIKEPIEQLYAKKEDKRNFLDIFLFAENNKPLIVELKRRDRLDLEDSDIEKQVLEYRKAI